jgi:hypothetical protein
MWPFLHSLLRIKHLRSSSGLKFATTSWDTRRCPGWAMAKPDSIFSYITKTTEKFVEMCHCKICAMLPTKGSSTYAKLRHTHINTHVQEKGRQHREWIQCLFVQLGHKRRHVTKWECYLVRDISLKFCLIDNVFVLHSGGKKNNVTTGICKHLVARTPTHTHTHDFQLQHVCRQPPSVHDSRNSTTYHAHPYFPSSVVR